MFAKNNSLQSDSNIYWATNSKPAWNFANNWHYSLSDWQSATGQDVHSKYVDPMGDSALNNHMIDPGTTDNKNRLNNKTGSRTKPANTIGIGSKAPDFELKASTKGKIKLTDLKGKTLLLSFINPHPTSKADMFQATRSQITFLKSMKTQYGDKGLRIILVDGTYRANKSDNSNTNQINFTYDNELGDIPLLLDQKSINVAGKYGVDILPTTFLISKNGIIIQRWENAALTSQLAFAIEGQTGQIHFR